MKTSTILGQFGHRLSNLDACNVGAQIKDLYTYVKKKFFVNYDKWSQQSKNFHYEALKTLKTLWFPALRL